MKYAEKVRGKFCELTLDFGWGFEAFTNLFLTSKNGNERTKKCSLASEKSWI